MKSAIGSAALRLQRCPRVRAPPEAGRREGRRRGRRQRPRRGCGLRRTPRPIRSSDVFSRSLLIGSQFCPIRSSDVFSKASSHWLSILSNQIFRRIQQVASYWLSILSNLIFRRIQQVSSHWLSILSNQIFRRIQQVSSDWLSILSRLFAAETADKLKSLGFCVKLQRVLPYLQKLIDAEESSIFRCLKTVQQNLEDKKFSIKRRMICNFKQGLRPFLSFSKERMAIFFSSGSCCFMKVKVYRIWIIIKCLGKTGLKVGTNENGSACGRWLSIGI
jgi:hypothetical protein